MTKKERNKLILPIAKELNLSVEKDMAYTIIEKSGFKILLGLLFDRCSDKNKFRPYYFGICLFDARDCFNLSFGDEITYPEDSRNVSFWDIESYSVNKHLICAKIRTFVNDITSFQTFLDAITNGKYPYYGNHENKWDICAYICIILRYKKKALSYLEKVISAVDPLNRPFIEDRRERATTVYNLLKQDNYEVIYNIFRNWQDRNIKELKLQI